MGAGKNRIDQAPRTGRRQRRNFRRLATQLVTETTDDLPEGGGNLYFTDERVDDRVGDLLVDGGGVAWTYDDNLGSIVAAVDHGSINGLSDDDHGQYVHTSVDRTITASHTVDAFTDIGGVAEPAAPSSGDRRLFVDAASSQLTVKLADGTTRSLEVGGSVLGLMSLSSGVINGGGLLSVNSGDNTTFDVGSGTGYIVDDWTDPTAPVIYEIALGSTAVAVTNLATAPATFVLVDVDGTLVQQTSPPDAVQRRERLYLGQLGHANNTNLAGVIQRAVPVESPINQLTDLAYALGSVNLGVRVAPSGANLKLDRIGGELFTWGANRGVDPTTPHLSAITPETELTFRMRTQTGAGAPTTTDLDVGNYDVGGVLTAVSPAVKWQNFRVYQLGNGNTVIQYGQNLYNSASNAIEAIPTESFTLLANLEGSAVLIGIITVQGNETDLGAGDAVFTAVSKFGGDLGGGGGGGTGVTDHGALTGLGDDDHTQYHTDARALTWLGTRSTTDIPEGTNLYYTQGRFDAAFAAKSTDDLPEGATNLYHTDERVDDRVASLIQDGNGVTWTYDDGANTLTPDVDHDATTNFVADEHVNHTSVTFTAGDGLTGGGDISANRSFAVDINGLVEESGFASGDFLMFFDTSAGVLRKVDYDDLPSGGGSATAKNSIEVDAGDLQLVNDEAAPGSGQLYGTDSAGLRGWLNWSNLALLAGNDYQGDVDLLSVFDNSAGQIKQTPVDELFTAPGVIEPTNNVTGSPVAIGTKWSLDTLTGGVGISIDTVANTFTLQPGAYFLLGIARVTASTAGSGTAVASLYDEDAAAYVGTLTVQIPSGSTFASNNVPLLFYSVVLTSATTYSLRLNNVTGSTQISTLNRSATAIVVQRYYAL